VYTFIGGKDLLAAWNRNILEKLIVAQLFETLLPFTREETYPEPE
jgi:hypothetical protein